MNVELLAKMIGQLVLDHDRVSLPGVGTFFAEMMPASFSDKGFSINPPYKTLSFNQMQTEDELLVTLYAKSNDIDVDVARPYVVQFLQELKLVLLERKTIILPGLGRLRTTRENNFFFVCDESLDIFPEGFALKPVSLKSLNSVQIEPVSIEVPLPPVPGSVVAPVEVLESVEEKSAHQEISETISEEVTAPDSETIHTAEPAPESELVSALAQELVPDSETIHTAEPTPEPESEAEIKVQDAESETIAAKAESESTPESEAEPEQNQLALAPRRKFRWWLLILILFAIAAIALASFLVLAHVAPDFIDSLLYTPEELRIIYY